jgi:pimeloyl-ACP methyl ester carboxylesterase
VKTLWISSSLFFLVMAAGCGESSSIWSKCSNYIYGTKYEFECTTLQVPLNWDQTDGETIDFFIRRRLGKADNNQSNHTQLWLLQGGPGVSGLPYAPLAAAIADTLPVDVYIPDHRGTGNSSRLSCPTYESASSDHGIEVTSAELSGCLQVAEQQWGEKLADFTTTAAARDVGYAIEHLNQLNDIQQDVFVFGNSYGTYWANRYFQIFPNQAVGGILDSVVSPSLKFTSVADDFEKVGEDLLTYCAKDANCNSKLGPDPKQFLVDLFNSIETGHCSALTAKFKLASQPELENVIKGILSELLEVWLYRVFIPPVLYRLSNCTSSDVTALFNLAVYLSSSPDTQFSSLLYWNISYSELWGDPPPSVDELRTREQLSYFDPGFASESRPMYDTWPRYPHDSYYNLWADTTVPLLILQGGLDPQTPYEQASKAADYFTAAYQYFVEFPISPHGIIIQSPMASAGSSVTDLNNQCGFKILVSFLNNRFSEPDLTCRDDIIPIEFTDRFQISNSLFGESDYWGDQSTSTAPLRVSTDFEIPMPPPINPSPFPR